MICMTAEATTVLTTDQQSNNPSRILCIAEQYITSVNPAFDLNIHNILVFYAKYKQ